eukprot:TRINITY_DN2803_c0_g1_i5.p1 TRINITY_DN2803_c0_g1~~TRINITY_DN2803_c0_g1_i5.p1  ORF type:complete len:420 (+),score=31.29 TRINITY_DN2803_c0_g1_i5:192-1451(+)
MIPSPDVFVYTPSTYWGIILQIVVLLLFPPVMIYQHTQRHTRFYVQRSYHLLALQHLGMFISGTILLVYDVLWPYWTLCTHFIWASFAPFVLFASPCVIRSLEYCLRYHITQKRKFLLEGGDLEQSRRLLSYVFLLALPNKLKIVLVMMIIQVIPAIVISGFQAGNPYQLTDIPDDPCPAVDAMILIVVAVIAFYVVVLLGTIVWIWKSADSYHIKTEFRAVLLVWTILFPFYIASSYHHGVNWYLPKAAVINLAFIFHISISGVWVSYKGWRVNRQSTVTWKRDLADSLRDTKFKQRFSGFLCLQLCIELLYFYEAVDAYRALVNDADLMRGATEIYNRYIALNSEYEINISAMMREDIHHAIFERRQVDRGLFDVASDEVFSLMKYHSLPLFLRRQEETAAESESSFDISLSSAVEV